MQGEEKNRKQAKKLHYLRHGHATRGLSKMRQGPVQRNASVKRTPPNKRTKGSLKEEHTNSELNTKDLEKPRAKLANICKFMMTRSQQTHLKSWQPKVLYLNVLFVDTHQLQLRR